MNILPVPVAPEREGSPSPLGGRKQDRSAFEAFDGEVRRAGSREAKLRDASAASDDEEGIPSTEAKGEEHGEARRIEAPARDVLGLLAGSDRGARPASDAQATSIGRGEADLAAAQRLAAPIFRAEGGEAGHEAREAPRTSADGTDDLWRLGRTAELLEDGLAERAGQGGPQERRAAGRLQILAQETHFEPTMREGVIVEAEGGDGPTGKVPEQDLLQMLFRRSDEGSPRREAAAPAARLAVHAEPRAERNGRLADPVAPLPQPSASPLNAAALATPVTGQVAARIIDAFSPLPAPAQAALDHPSAEAHLRLRAGGAALKTLTIQLQPVELGTVTVSMRLVEGRLALELAASRADTARILAEDRTALRQVLEKAGFNLEDAAISIVARETNAGAPVRDAEGAGGREADRSPDRQTRGEDEGRRERGSPGEGAQRGRAPERPAPAAGSGTIFL